MTKKIAQAIHFFKGNPASVLLFLVFLFVLPRCLSYDNAWVQPEQFYIKMGILKTGTALGPADIKQGFFWQLFEYQPRLTRPWSSYFEILDTKFRVWLWHYIMPLPSLSLTWIFSLILAPLFLFLLLRNIAVGTPLALCLVAFYMATPGVLSYEAMLFRPAKPMTNFCLIFFLYLASRLKKNYTDRQLDIPFRQYFVFWAFSAFSLYWDETALLIFPALFFFFPEVLRRKTYLALWLSLPLITWLMYFEVFPCLSSLAGHGVPHLDNYDKFAFLKNINGFCASLHYLGIDSKNLVLDTMGIWTYSAYAIKSISDISVIPWLVLGFYIVKTKNKFHLSSLFLVFLLFYFDYLLEFCSMQPWGPYYYGTYWSVFFVIGLSYYLKRAGVPQKLLVVCFFFIILNCCYIFLATNTIYKRYHYYPYNPGVIELYFQGQKDRFSPSERPFLSGQEIKADIKEYWMRARSGKPLPPSLPKELCWLPIETQPSVTHTRYTLLETNNNNYIDAK